MENNRIYFRKLRKSKEIRLRELAEYLKCGVSLLSLYENGHTGMSEEKIKRYRKYITEKE